MKVGIVGTEGGWHVAGLQAALAARGIAAPCFPITRLVARLAGRPRLAAGWEALDGYDAVLVRSIPGGSLEQVIFRVDALHRLEKLGVRVVNSAAAIERTVDKYYTSALLEEAGLPTPRTVVTERFDEALGAFEELGGDVVVKPLFGSEGQGMVRVSDPEIAYRVFRALEQSRLVFYVQEFVPHGNADIRAFVLGGRVIAGMLRRGTSWKSNIAQGAVAEPLALSAALEEMAVRAAAALDATYAGVDILPLETGGHTVIEVNGIPAWQGLQAATGVDVAEQLVAYLLQETA